MAKARIAPHRLAPPSLSEIVRLAKWLSHHALAICTRAGAIAELERDDNPDVEKVEVARAMFSKIIARRLVLLVGDAPECPARGQGAAQPEG